MTDIYKQFDTAFRDTSAYLIFDKLNLDNMEPVARAAFKYAKSGMRTTCFFQVFGAPMSKGMANGYGYDKTSASAENAIAKHASPDNITHVDRLKSALASNGVQDWKTRIENAGYIVTRGI